MSGLLRSGSTPVCVPQAERRLSCVNAGSKKFKFENGLKIAESGRRRCLHAEACLTHTEVNLAVRRILVLKRCELRRAHHIEPIWIALTELVAGIHHHVSVEINGILLFLRLCFSGCFLSFVFCSHDDRCGRGGRRLRRRRRLLALIKLSLEFFYLLLKFLQFVPHL